MGLRNLPRLALMTPLSCALIFIPQARAATLLELSVTGTATRPPDETDARLTAHASAATAAAAQANLNRLMASTLQQARAVQGITVTTSNYNVSPIYPKRTDWEAEQSLDLVMQAAPDSSAVKPMLALIGKIQQSGVTLESLTGSLTGKARRQAEQAAIENAVKRLKAQADTVALALGDQPGSISSLRLNISQPSLPMFNAPMAMAKAMAPSLSAAPVAAQVTLSGTVTLQAPKQRSH